MAQLAEQVITLRAEGLSGIRSAFNQVRSIMGQTASAAGGVFSRIGSAIGSVFNPMNVLQGFGIGIGMSMAQGLGSAARSAIQLASATESLATSFEVLLGSGTAARTMIDDINKFAAATPFEQMELGDVAKQLLAYGTSAENIIPTMRQLGDIAALSGANLGDLASIYGKIQAQGRLTAETLEGWQSRGIPITRELAAVLGVAESQVRELVAKGQVGFPSVQQAIARLTSQGGQFAGGMEKLSQTTAGLWSTVTGNLKTAMAEIGTGIIEAFDIKGALASAGAWLGELSGRIKALVTEWAEPIQAWAATAYAGFRMVWEMAAEFYSAIGSLIRSLFGDISGMSLQEWATAFLHELEFVFLNWKLVLQIAWERFRMWIDNMILRIRTFAANAGILFRWVAENWLSILMTMWNYGTTVFSNLITNLRELWSAFLRFLRGGGWRFNWTPLTEGFKSEIKKLPEFVEAGVAETTPALKALEDELARRRRQFEAEKTAKPKEQIQDRETPQAPQIPVTQAAAAASPAAEAAEERKSGAAFVGFAELARSMQQKVLEDMQKKTMEASQKTADGVQRLAAAASGGALRVQIVGGQEARYG